MNKTYQEGLSLAREINDYLRYKEHPGDALVILAPPFIHLAKIARDITKPNLSVAAQDCSAEVSGAYTGEVSAAMIASAGARHVIIGHSERRQYHGETGPLLARKVARAIDNNLGVIFCVGETLDQRNANAHLDIVANQLAEGLAGVPADRFPSIVIAYEPVWAIGTGVTATPAQAQEMHAFLRSVIARDRGNDIASATPILYGGSCSPANARELFACPDVDGGLVGGASLKAADFFEIIQATARQ